MKLNSKQRKAKRLKAKAKIASAKAERKKKREILFRNFGTQHAPKKRVGLLYRNFRKGLGR